MGQEFAAFAARACLAAIVRQREALKAGDIDAASASLTEWVLWWGIVDDTNGPTGGIDGGLRDALRQVRNAATHRKVNSGELPHAAYPGMAIVGATAVGQTWLDQAWLPGIPADERIKSAEKRRAQQRIYAEHLALKSTLHTGEIVRRALTELAQSEQG